MFDFVRVWIMRCAVIGVGAAAYYLAIVGSETLVQLLLGAYGSIAQFAPAVYGALFWRRASAPGVLAGLVVGVVVNFYYQLVAASTPADLHPGIVGLVANLVVFAVVSALTRPAPAPELETIDPARAEPSSREETTPG